MHSPYFQSQTSAPYTGFQTQYSPMITQGPPGIAIANAAIPPQTNAGTKPGTTGQKRKQVKNACVNCQKACKKCDEGRPCQRCVKYGLTDTCQDSTRKERKKGIKRGPYKRRQPNNQSANASASPSNVALANPMGTQSSYSNNNMRPTMPFAYTPQNMNQFNQPYDPLNHHNYGYQPNYQKDHLMQGQYMANMFPGGNQALYNPMVPQQQEILSRSVSLSPPLSSNFVTKTNSPMQHHSQTHTPASTNSPSNAASPNPNDNEEEEGSKLAILSQLCSTVLDNNDAPKSEEVDHNSLSLEQQRGVSQEHSQLAGLKKRHGGLSNQTPPPSPHHAHSRTPSYDHDHPHSHQSQVYHPNHNSPHNQQPHYTMNGHLSAPQRVPLIYGTPNSSPSASPTDASFSITVNNSPKNGHIAVSQSQQSSNSTTSSPSQGFWPLPPLNTVVPSEHYSYGNNHYQANGNSHVQSQNGQNDWGIHAW